MTTLRELREANPIYFHKDTLKYYGERLSDMRILKTRENITDSMGKKHEQAIVVSKKSKGVRSYAYFDKDTLKLIQL